MLFETKKMQWLAKEICTIMVISLANILELPQSCTKPLIYQYEKRNSVSKTAKSILSTLCDILVPQSAMYYCHDEVIKWKDFLRYWHFVWGIHWSPVNSPHEGQCRGALMFSLICVSINGWVNNLYAGDLRCYCTHYDIIVMERPLW